MNVLVKVFNQAGAARGEVLLNLDFGPPARWSLVEDPSRMWSCLDLLQEGAMIMTGSGVALQGQLPGKPPQPVLLLNENPMSSIYGGGVGTVASSSDPSLVGGDIYWSRELSPIRKAMLDVLRQWIPRPCISSDEKAFRELTDYTTQRLFDEFWEPENRRPPWEPGKQPKKNTGFTCCNMVVGALACRLGRVLGKPLGTHLRGGVRQLHMVNSERPGSWVWSNSGRAPQVGDFYAEKGFQHVGTIGELQEGLWVAYDGGQGGYASKRDYIKKVPRYTLVPTSLEGWVDIDVYFK